MTKTIKAIDYATLSDKKLEKIVDQNYARYFTGIAVDIMNLSKVTKSVMTQLRVGLTMDQAFNNAITLYGEKGK